MNPYRVANRWEEATFRDRPNRFTLVLGLKGKTVRAYLPNTGRLEEYLVEGTPFFIAPFRSEKFTYRTVSTFYQGCYVLLDTIEMNNLAGALIQGGFISGLEGRTAVFREQSMGSSRFDFIVERKGAPPLIVEVKTCTLSHNGVAMFPDAPTKRTRSHVEHLGNLGQGGYDTAMFFIIPNANTSSFMPNFHTDPEFSQALLDERSVSYRAFSLRLNDPVCVDLDSVKEIPVNLELPGMVSRNSGTYLLLLENDRMRRLQVGGLGQVTLQRGHYVYVGSGMGSLEARAGRHFKTRKKRFWHIDYLTPEHLKPKKLYLIRRPDRIETAVARRLRAVASGCIEGFGASDTGAGSHLFYFDAPPSGDRDFMDTVLDFRTFTERTCTIRTG